MAAGEILAEEEEAVILEEETQVGEEEEGAQTQTLSPTNSQGSNQLFSRAIDESQKPSCKNGTYIRASIDTPRK